MRRASAGGTGNGCCRSTGADAAWAGTRAMYDASSARDGEITLGSDAGQTIRAYDTRRPDRVRPRCGGRSTLLPGASCENAGPQPAAATGSLTARSTAPTRLPRHPRGQWPTPWTMGSRSGKPPSVAGVRLVHSPQTPSDAYRGSASLLSRSRAPTTVHSRHALLEVSQPSRLS